DSFPCLSLTLGDEKDGGTSICIPLLMFADCTVDPRHSFISVPLARVSHTAKPYGVILAGEHGKHISLISVGSRGGDTNQERQLARVGKLLNTLSPTGTDDYVPGVRTMRRERRINRRGISTR